MYAAAFLIYWDDNCYKLYLSLLASNRFGCMQSLVQEWTECIPYIKMVQKFNLTMSR